MSENIGKVDKSDKKLPLSLSDVPSEVLQALKDVSSIKSSEWNAFARYKLHWLSCCKLSRLCEDCKDTKICQHYRLIRDFFKRYGFNIYPYTLSKDGKVVRIDRNMGFYHIKAKDAIFVCSTCFEYLDDPRKSALCVAFHELLNAISKIKCKEYEILMASITCIDHYKEFESHIQANMLQTFRERQLPKNELLHCYLANNKETKCLLEAIFMGDNDFQPPEVFCELYKQLINFTYYLEVRGKQV